MFLEYLFCTKSKGSKLLTNLFVSFSLFFTNPSPNYTNGVTVYAIDFIELIFYNSDLLILVKRQEEKRRELERKFMSMCGWHDMTDKKWYNMIDRGRFIPGDFYKHGDDPRAGSVAVKLKYNHLYRNGWFKVAPLHENLRGEKHVSQIAVFILDRLLGLYYAVPSKGLILNITQLESLPLPPKFRIFIGRLRDLVGEEGLLQGTVNAWVDESLVIPDFRLLEYHRIPGRLKRLHIKDLYELEFRVLLWITGLALQDHNTRVTNITGNIYL
ncbi:uncharacterized protein LOC144345873 [Saccoglossus kowalevskii]